MNVTKSVLTEEISRGSIGYDTLRLARSSIYKLRAIASNEARHEASINRGFTTGEIEKNAARCEAREDKQLPFYSILNRGRARALTITATSTCLFNVATWNGVSLSPRMCTSAP